MDTGAASVKRVDRQQRRSKLIVWSTLVLTLHRTHTGRHPHRKRDERECK